MARSSRRKKKSIPFRERLRGMIPPLPAGSLRPALRGVAWVLGLSAIGAAWAFGVPVLQARVTAAVHAPAVTIDFRDRPAWVDDDLLARLETIARTGVTDDPFAQPELAASRAALLETGWFADVAQVRRAAPDRIEIDATFLRPFAVVRDRDGDHQVDPDGRLLPRTYPHGGARAPWVVIRGAHFDRPVRPGLAWDGADVGAALALLRQFDTRPWKAQISAVDVSAHFRDGTLVLVTDIGARIAWGSPPGAERALEVLAERKLAYLDKAYEEFGRIDTGFAGEWQFYEQAYRAE